MVLSLIILPGSAIAAISSVLFMDYSSSYLHLEFTISILFIQSQRPYPSYGMPLCTVIPVFTVNVKVNPPFSLYFQAFFAILPYL